MEPGWRGYDRSGRAWAAEEMLDLEKGLKQVEVVALDTQKPEELPAVCVLGRWVGDSTEDGVEPDWGTADAGALMPTAAGQRFKAHLFHF